MSFQLKTRNESEKKALPVIFSLFLWPYSSFDESFLKVGTFWNEWKRLMIPCACLIEESQLLILCCTRQLRLWGKQAVVLFEYTCLTPSCKATQRISPVGLLPGPAGWEVNSAECSYGSVIQLSSARLAGLTAQCYILHTRESTSGELAVFVEQIAALPHLKKKKKKSLCLLCRTSSTVTGVTIRFNVRGSQCFEKFNNIV